jgi:hypothetical protein
MRAQREYTAELVELRLRWACWIADGTRWQRKPTTYSGLAAFLWTRRWQGFADQADKEGWPAACFLAALAE